jgi:hypothetical protein
MLFLLSADFVMRYHFFRLVNSPQGRGIGRGAPFLTMKNDE